MDIPWWPVKAYHFERLKCFWPSDEYHLNILSFIIRFFEKCKSMPYFHVDWKVKIDQILRLIQQHITSCFLWLLATLKEDGHFAFSNFNARFKIETLGFMFLMATFSELQSKNCTCLLKLQLPSPTGGKSPECLTDLYLLIWVVMKNSRSCRCSCRTWQLWIWEQLLFWAHLIDRPDPGCHRWRVRRRDSNRPYCCN